MPEIAWGVLGTGAIARKFAAAVEASTTGRLVAVGSRTTETAESFRAECGGDRAYGSYDAVLADDEVDAVYIATPHPDHKHWAIAAAHARKQLLVEKPLTLNARDTEEVLAVADACGVFLLEAYQYRSHPQTHLLVDLLRDGVIGEVRMIDASFGFHAPFNASSRLFDPALGGGGILDVGCYPVSLSVLLARALGFSTEAVVSGGGFRGTTGVDEWAAATLVFDDTLVAQVATAISAHLENAVHVVGSTGRIAVPVPWLPGQTSMLRISRPGKPDEERGVEASAGVFTLEVDTVAEHLGTKESPTMPWADTLATMRILDAWRAAAGVSYPEEKL